MTKEREVKISDLLLTLTERQWDSLSTIMRATRALQDGTGTQLELAQAIVSLDPEDTHALADVLTAINELPE